MKFKLSWNLHAIWCYFGYSKYILFNSKQTDFILLNRLGFIKYIEADLVLHSHNKLSLWIPWHKYSPLWICSKRSPTLAQSPGDPRSAFLKPAQQVDSSGRFWLEMHFSILYLLFQVVTLLSGYFYYGLCNTIITKNAFTQSTCMTLSSLPVNRFFFFSTQCWRIPGLTKPSENETGETMHLQTRECLTRPGWNALSFCLSRSHLNMPQHIRV